MCSRVEKDLHLRVSLSSVTLSCTEGVSIFSPKNHFSSGAGFDLRLSQVTVSTFPSTTVICPPCSTGFLFRTIENDCGGSRIKEKNWILSMMYYIKHFTDIKNRTFYESNCVRINWILPRTTSLAGFEASWSCASNVELVTWHSQSPSSYWMLTSLILKLQSPPACRPAHSYLPGCNPIGCKWKNRIEHYLVIIERKYRL